MTAFIYKILPLPPDSVPAAYDRGTSINDYDAVAGIYQVAGGLQSSFVYSNGSSVNTGYTTISINSGGQILELDTSTNTYLVVTSGTPTPLATPPIDYPNNPTTEKAVGINASGQIAWTDYIQTGANYALISDPLASPNQTFITGINDLGQVTGYYRVYTAGYSTPAQYGFIYSQGNYTTLDDTNENGLATTAAEAINNAGQVVGYYRMPDNSLHSFIYSGGTYQDIMPIAGANTFIVMGINNKGDITGYYTYNNGQNSNVFIGHPFIFTTDADVVDFNNLSADQKNVLPVSDVYHGSGGNDIVALPYEANYIAVGWTDTSSSTFFTQSRLGDNYQVIGGDGSYFISAGAGNDTISITGAGYSTITGGTGKATITISGNGNNTIFAGTGSAIVSISGAGYNVISGALTGSASITGGGLLEIKGNLTGSSTVQGSSTLQYDGRASGASVSSGNKEIVATGASVSGTVVSSSGTLIVSGGIASSAVVSTGGLVIERGGVDFATVVSSGGLVTVSSGGSDSSATISAGGRLIVSSGGSASTIVIKGGGSALVGSGGSATGAAISASAILTINSGGSASNPVVSGGTLVVSGTASNASVLNGGVVSNVGRDDINQPSIRKCGNGRFRWSQRQRQCLQWRRNRRVFRRDDERRSDWH